MKILVTGGTGYIGSHTVVELQNQGHEVEILDNLFNSKITVLDKIKEITGKFPVFYQIDLLDYPKVHDLFAGTKYDAVIHFAGLKAVAESIEQPLRYYENNVTGTLNLLKCMAEFQVNKIIFSSSATVYGNTNSGKLDESMVTGVGITNPYGETKHVIEKILEAESQARPELSVVLLRYFNPVGAHSSGLLGEDPNGIPNNLMPVVMRVAEGKIRELQVYGNDYDTPDGTCIRDYIHVVDLAKGHLAALKATDTPGTKIYNLGSKFMRIRKKPNKNLIGKLHSLSLMPCEIPLIFSIKITIKLAIKQLKISSQGSYFYLKLIFVSSLLSLLMAKIPDLNTSTFLSFFDYFLPLLKHVKFANVLELSSTNTSALS